MGQKALAPHASNPKWIVASNIIPWLLRRTSKTLLKKHTSKPDGLKMDGVIQLRNLRRQII